MGEKNGYYTLNTELLTPRLGSTPGPKMIDRYFCKVLLTIAREGLSVKIYLDHLITEKIALKELGVSAHETLMLIEDMIE